MPLYEYQCEECKTIHELFMNLSDTPPTSCPKYKQGPLRKIMSRTHFVLKGQGWYETDFKNKKSGKEEQIKESVKSESKVTSEKKENKTKDKATTENKSKKETTKATS